VLLQITIYADFKQAVLNIKDTIKTKTLLVGSWGVIKSTGILVVILDKPNF
jgi:hypothetical protein